MVREPLWHQLLEQEVLDILNYILRYLLLHQVVMVPNTSRLTEQHSDVRAWSHSVYTWPPVLCSDGLAAF